MTEWNLYYLVAAIFGGGAVIAILLRQKVPKIIGVSLFVVGEMAAVLGVFNALANRTFSPLDLLATVAVVASALFAGAVLLGKNRYDNPTSITT